MGVQPRHSERFHVKHFDVWRKRCDFRVGMLALHCHPHATGLEQSASRSHHVGQRGEGSGRDHFGPKIANELKSGMDRMQIRNRNLGRRLPDKRCLLPHRVDAGNLQFRTHHRQDRSGQAGTAARVDNPLSW